MKKTCCYSLIILASYLCAAVYAQGEDAGAAAGNHAAAQQAFFVLRYDPVTGKPSYVPLEGELLPGETLYTSQFDPTSGQYVAVPYTPPAPAAPIDAAADISQPQSQAQPSETAVEPAAKDSATAISVAQEPMPQDSASQEHTAAEPAAQDSSATGAVVQEIEEHEELEELVMPDTAAEPVVQDSAIVESIVADTAAAKPELELIAEDGKPKIAVYVTGGVAEDQRKALGTRMLASLVNSGRYHGVERTAEFLETIDKEHITQRSGAVDDSEIRALGKQFGVKYVCIADITPFGRSFQVSARIVDVETAQVVAIGDSYSPLKTPADLKQAADEAVRIMFKEKGKKKITFSIGAGGMLNTDFGGGVNTLAEDIKMPYTGFGGFFFIDAQYFALYVSYSTGDGKWESDDLGYDPDLMPDILERSALSIGAFIKYPFAVGRQKNMLIYPMAGVDYELSTSGNIVLANGRKIKFDDGGVEESSQFNIGGYERPNTDVLNTLWIKAGLGLDVSINRSFFIRSEALYGVRTSNMLEDMYVEYCDGGETKTGHGVTAKVGVGYRF